MSEPAREAECFYTARVKHTRRIIVGGLATLWLAGCAADGLKPGAESVLDVFAQPTATESVRDATDPYDADKRYRGTLALAMRDYASEPIYLKLFTDNIKDRDSSVRAAAARALAAHGKPEHAALLIEALKDKDVSVRVEAARGLQRLHSPDAIDPLLAHIREPVLVGMAEDAESDPDVRSECASALGQYREPKVLKSLIAALGDSRLQVNRNTLESLRTLTGQDFGYDRQAWQTWFERTPQHFAAGRPYRYPAFKRDKTWMERLPFVPPPPNEESNTPAGMPITPPKEADEAGKPSA